MTASPFEIFSKVDVIVFASQDMDTLADLPKLKMLSLIGNPVTTKSNYRQAENVTRREASGARARSFVQNALFKL